MVINMALLPIKSIAYQITSAGNHIAAYNVLTILSVMYDDGNGNLVIGLPSGANLFLYDKRMIINAPNGWYRITYIDSQ